MQLLVFRHGIAQDISEAGSDENRALTEDGIQKTRKAALGLAKLIDRPDVILTSPLVRARQTADILGEVLHSEPRVLKALAYGPAGAVIGQLRRRREETVIVVGHEPTLSQVVEMLLTGNEPSHFVQMKKAGCACVDTPLPDHGVIGGGRLLWLATPRMLRGMA